MTEEGSKLPGRTWNAISIGAFLLSIALAIVVYITTRDLGNSLWTLLIVFGLFVAVSSPFKDRSTDNFGPSPADAGTAGGIILAGIGAAGLVYGYTHEVLYTVVVIIVIMAVVGIFMAVKNRNM